MGIAQAVAEALLEHPAVKAIQLVGSRARGDATVHSDWDFEVTTDDFPALSNAMPSLVGGLRPVAQQWDPLSKHRTFMLILQGPVKVDLFFDVPNDEAHPWIVNAETLRAIDDHFWDWILWLASKETSGRGELVDEELQKMFVYLLEPLGIRVSPVDLTTTVGVYVDARREQERARRVRVSRTLEREVRGAINRGRRIEPRGHRHRRR